MTRPKLLDLYCCAGGAALGYHRAGFDVTGVDIDPQPNYPYGFMQADALALDDDFLARFDAIHASPPCQAFSDLAKRNGNAADWPDLIGGTRDLLESAGKPWVIENVEGAPLLSPIVLCGTMFPGLRVIRHRLFETSFPAEQPRHIPHGEHPLVHTLDKRKNHYGKTCEWTDFVQGDGRRQLLHRSGQRRHGHRLDDQEGNKRIDPASLCRVYGSPDHASVAGERKCRG